MEDRELRDRLRMAGYMSERDRQDDGHASGNGPYPMRGSMTSEQYIIKLMQTIGSLDTTMKSMRDELGRLREKDAANDLERKRLMAMIGDSKVKAIMTDGYVAYKHLDADDSRIGHLADLAHIRTKFIDWIEVAPDEDAAEMIWDFNELFRLERQYRRMELTYEQIQQARISPETMEVLQRIVDRLTKLEKRMTESIEGIPKVGERAVNYMRNLWASVLKWCRDGRYSLDNNLAERCARPVALMRKNILHFASHKGAEVYAILGSLVESCRMKGLSVLRYLEKVIQEVNDGNKDYESLLPGVLTV